MKNSPIHFLVLCAALCAFGSVAAYEWEDAVPFTIDAELGKVTLERLAISLHGRDVEISMKLANGGPAAQRVAFSAASPIFGLLGEGEEHADKTFADLTVSHDGQTRHPKSYRRGYFLGQDITMQLSTAGLGPLPDPNASTTALARVKFPLKLKPNAWQGYVSYAWSNSMPPRSSSVAKIRYRSLPEFRLDELSSASFTRLVQQHCGDPVRLAHELDQQVGTSRMVILERFDLPLKFMRSQEVALDIVQTGPNWLDAQPLASLVCGMNNPDNKATISGTLDSANQTISILVISRVADLQ